MKKSITTLLLSFSLMLVPLCADEKEDRALGELLREALFAEEADRDLPKAEAGYRDIITRFDSERAYAATAILRLAELLNTAGKKAEAEKWFARVLQEFPDQEAVAKVARVRLGDKATELVGPGAAGTRPLSGEEVRIEELKKMLAESPDLLDYDSPDGNNWIPLALAARNREAHVVKFLIGQGVRIDGAGGSQAPITWSVRNGDLAITKQLLDAGSKLQDDLLHTAVLSGHYAMSKLLLEAGADPNQVAKIDLQPDKNGRVVADQNSDSPFSRPMRTNGNSRVTRIVSPLEVALYKRYSRLTDLLLNKGASAGSEGDKSSHALRYAIIDKDTELVGRLLKAGADPNSIWQQGISALHFAAMYDDPAITKLLLEAGAEIDPLNDKGYTPLFLSSEETSPLLLDAGADVNVVGKDGKTVLHIHQTGERIKQSVAAGAKLDVVDEKGYTPLQKAITFDAFEALVDAGADVSLSGPSGTALHILATRTPNDTLAKRIKKLIAAGADPDQFDDAGRTALNLAAQYLLVENVRALLEAGANPNGPPNSLPPLASLPEANGTKQPGLGDVIRALVDAGAAPDTADRLGVTALVKAAGQGDEATIDYLLEKGALLVVNGEFAYDRNTSSKEIKTKLFRATLDQEEFRTGKLRIVVPETCEILAEFEPRPAADPATVAQDCPHTLLEVFGFACAGRELAIKKIQVWRIGENKPLEFDLREIISSRDAARDGKLHWGDVVECHRANQWRERSIGDEEKMFLHDYLKRSVELRWVGSDLEQDNRKVVFTPLWGKLPDGRWAFGLSAGMNFNAYLPDADNELSISMYRLSHIGWNADNKKFKPQTWSVLGRDSQQDPLDDSIQGRNDSILLEDGDVVTYKGQRELPVQLPRTRSSGRRVVLPPKTR